jgi:hypothetical protein
MIVIGLKLAISKDGMMLGDMVLKWKRRRTAPANISYAVLPDYHRDLLSPKARRRWIIAFFAANFVFGFLFALMPDSAKPMMASPILFLAALIVWMLPETGNPPARMMTRMFFAYFIALILWPYYLAIQIPGAPLIEIRRAFLFLSVFFFLVSLSVSHRFIQEMKAIISPYPLFMKFFYGFILAQLLSMIGTREPTGSALSMIKNQMAWTCVFFISAYILSKPGQILRFSNLIRIVATILAILALFEYRNQGILWAKHIPSFLTVSDPAMIRLLSPVFREGDYRVTGTFSVSLCFAEFMSLTLPFFLQYLVVGRNRLYKLIVVVCDVLVINAIILTQARVGIVGIMVTHGIYGFIWSIRFWRTRKDSLFGPMIALQVLLGRHRLGQDLHHGQGDRGGAAPGPDPRAQQDAGRAALRRVQELLPRQRGRIFRLLLRLLPARGLCPAHRHLYREGIVDQRADRPDAPLGDARAAGARRRDHRRLGLLHLRHRLGRDLFGDDLRPEEGRGVDQREMLAELVALQYKRNDAPSCAAPSACAATRSRSSRPTMRTAPGASPSSATRSRRSPSSIR